MILDAEKLFNKAAIVLQEQTSSKEQLCDSFDIFNALLNHDPKNAHLLFMLATTASRMGYTSLSIMLYEICIKLTSEEYLKCSPWLNLGSIHKQNGKPDLAMRCYREALACIPDKDKIDNSLKEHFHRTKLELLINLGSNYVGYGLPDEGLKYLDEAIKGWPEDKYEEVERAKWNKSLLLLEKGNYEEGFKLYDCVKCNESSRPLNRQYPPGDIPLWDGTKGKKVIVIGEQGIGDEIMFASIIPDLMKDCEVVIDAHLRLADIFRRSFGVPVYGTREFDMLLWQHEGIEARIPIGSLARFYRNKKEDFPGTPYLKADEKLINKHKQLFSVLDTDKPFIGISWRGGVKSTNKNERTINLEELIPLFKSIDANWISLQYHASTESVLEKFYKDTGIKIHHFSDSIDDYDMTAALVSCLDHVISVPQSVVHLAGALGKKTWQIVPKKSMWQMGVYGKDMPWYKSVKNYWKQYSLSWEPTIELMAGDLKKEYKNV